MVLTTSSSAHFDCVVAGLVVGKKGTTISSIKQETKATLVESKLPIPGSLWSQIVIHGEPRSVRAAYDAVAAIIDSKSGYQLDRSPSHVSCR